MGKKKKSFPLVLYVVVYFLLPDVGVAVLRKKKFEINTTVFFVVVAIHSGKCRTKKKEKKKTELFLGRKRQVSTLLLVRLADKRGKTNGVNVSDGGVG